MWATALFNRVWVATYKTSSKNIIYLPCLLIAIVIVIKSGFVRLGPAFVWRTKCTDGDFGYEELSRARSVCVGGWEEGGEWSRRWKKNMKIRVFRPTRDYGKWLHGKWETHHTGDQQKEEAILGGKWKNNALANKDCKQSTCLLIPLHSQSYFMLLHTQYALNTFQSDTFFSTRSPVCSVRTGFLWCFCARNAWYISREFFKHFYSAHCGSDRDNQTTNCLASEKRQQKMSFITLCKFLWIWRGQVDTMRVFVYDTTMSTTLYHPKRVNIYCTSSIWAHLHMPFFLLPGLYE